MLNKLIATVCTLGKISFYLRFQQVSFVMLLFMEREYFLNKKIRQGHLAFTPGIPQSGIEQHT